MQVSFLNAGGPLELYLFNGRVEPYSESIRMGVWIFCYTMGGTKKKGRLIEVWRKGFLPKDFIKFVVEVLVSVS